MALNFFSDEELQAELERRKALEKRPPEPIPASERDYSALASTVICGVEKAAKDKYEDDDFSHYVYEAAMEAIYGKSYWQWRNKQRW